MRVILLALIAILVYQLAICSGIIPKGRGVSNSQENLIVAENWKYLERQPVCVFVGSSKTACLPFETESKNCAMLAFHAMGSLTGLEILAKTEELPRQIVVEIGSAGIQTPGLDPTLVQAADRSVFNLGDMLTLLRHEYQPLNVLFGLVYQQLNQHDLATFDHARAIKFVGRGKEIPLTAEQSSRLDVEALKIKNLICLLQRRGAEIVIYDPPTEFDQSAYESTVHRRLRAWFRPAQFTWIDNPSMPLHTVDGIHLIGDSAEEYAKFILMKVHSLSQPKESAL